MPTSLDSGRSQVIAYAIGVGIGTLIGLTINERLTPTTDPALRIPYSSKVASTERALPRAIACAVVGASSCVAHDRVDDDAVEDVVGGGVEAAGAGQAEQLGGDAGSPRHASE